MEDRRPLQSIPDDELLHRLAQFVSQGRAMEAAVIAHISEVDERRLFARQAFPSMFAYCMAVLHFSEAEAYLRIAAARASREHPMLVTMLADGRLHLTAIALLAPHLTRENRGGLLERATHRSKRQILELLAEIAPRPDVPAVMRKVPERGAPSSGLPCVPTRGKGPIPGLVPDGVGLPAPGALNASAVVPAAPAVVQPLSPGRYKVQFTASAELHDKLERLQSAMGSKVAKGDLAAIIEQAVTEKLERLERRLARTKGREVCERDGDRCRYVDEQGRRCPARDRLEFHHRHPFALGGHHSVDNIRLMCRPHNAYLAECDYGREAMARHQRPSGGASQTAPG